MELQNFFNAGDVWICKRCDEKITRTNAAETTPKLPRYYREGEAESKQTTFSAPIATWEADVLERRLVCPHCGISELTEF